MAVSEVHLNRAFTNNVFSSWRLGSDPAASLLETVPLSGSVRRKEQQSYDYLHTRLSLLANRLYQLGEDLYTFLEESDGLSLYKYTNDVGLHQVVALGTPEMVTAPGVAPDLECSLAAVQISDDQEQGSEASKLFIASNGHGNMVLITESGRSSVIPVSQSAATPALQPFIVEAAYQVLPGIVRVVLWTIKDKTSQHPASCVLSLATLCYDLDARKAHLKTLHSLGQSKLPPHAVVVSAKDDAVVLAIDPADPHAPAGSNVGLGASGLPDDAAVDMDDDMPSPRTLRAAAERLAQYTSDTQETASGAVSTVFSDLYSEASPADEAANLETDSVVLLTSQASGITREGALLGLIDDVDCAVVSVTCSSADSPASALEHVASIPAFAYVATGKPQRKFVLLGKPGRKVAAVIVEANKFAFIYNSVQSDAPNGIHQVLDLGLEKNTN
ncbi:hypothetical protein WJX75_007872 [Coccomyxa subellipsoidea]|uniref:Uncharacterized protein n=1 Tax=Coccomyxa subellipsoidea TaxID=248742 RepID=A0ABR2YJ81_9CHLO